MATRRLPVEYILRKLLQEGLEGEPVDRVREAFDNKYTGVYMHKFCWERATGNVKLHTKISSSVQKSMIHTKVADKSFIVCIGLKVASFCDLPRKGW